MGKAINIKYIDLSNLSISKLNIELDKLYNTLNKEIEFGSSIGFDLETTGLSFLKDKVLLVSITTQISTYIINVFSKSTLPTNNYILGKLTEVLFVLDNNKYPIWIGHNLPFDLRFTYLSYLDINKKYKYFNFVYCTHIAENKIFQGLDKSNTLDSLFSLRLGVDISKEVRDSFYDPEKVKKIIEEDIYVPTKEQVEYAALDTIGLDKLMELQIDNMTEVNMHDHVINIEMGCINAIIEAEIRGIKHDTESWIKVAEDKEKELAIVEDKLLKIISKYSYNEENINPNYFKDKEKYQNQIEKALDRVEKLNIEIETTKNKETKKYANLLESREKNREKIEVYTEKLNEHLNEPIINWSSSAQIIQVMIEIGMEESNQMVTKRDGKVEKYSVAEDARTQWMVNNKNSKYYPFVEAIDEYKKILSLIDKYGKKWVESYVHEGDRVYTEYRQMGTVTGRLASGKSKLGFPNLQQIPRGVEYRQCFISDPGKLFMTIDWSSAELCLIIGVSEDQNLLKAFKTAGDAHGYVGSLCWKDIFKYRAKIEKVLELKEEFEQKSKELIVSKKENKDLRTKFKNVHFGVLYGAYVSKIAETMEITKQEAELVVNRIQDFEKVAYNFLKQSAVSTMLNGYTLCHKAINTLKYSTPAVEYLYSKGYLSKEGREYLKELETNPLLEKEKDKFIDTMVSEIRKVNFMKSIELDTKTRNYPIQGSQAEALKIYLVEYLNIKKKYHLDDLEFNLTVHDEVVHQFPQYYDSFVPNIIYKTMCDAPSIFLNGILDIEAEYHIGTSWEK